MPHLRRYALLSLLWLAACGQSGDLYLPDDKPDIVPVTQPGAIPPAVPPTPAPPAEDAAPDSSNKK